VRREERFIIEGGLCQSALGRDQLKCEDPPRSSSALQQTDRRPERPADPVRAREGDLLTAKATPSSCVAA